MDSALDASAPQGMLQNASGLSGATTLFCYVVQTCRVWSLYLIYDLHSSVIYSLSIPTMWLWDS